MASPRLARRVMHTCLTGAALILALSAPVQALTNSEIANLKGADRQKVLEEGARKEGTVLWYSTLVVDQATRPIMDAFNKKYPFIKGEYHRDGSTGLLQRILAEYQAKSMRVDVYSASYALSALKLPLHEPFTSPSATAYPKEYLLPNGVGVIYRLTYHTLAYNTNMIPKDRVPKDYPDLLDPFFKGKMSWGSSSSSGAPAMISFWRKIWGEEKTEEYLTKLSKQDIKSVADAGRSVLDQVIAGEYALTLAAATNHIAISINDGAPVAAILPPIVHSAANSTSMIKGAPHPHAAMLFVDFLLAKDGAQEIMKQATYVPAHPEVEPLAEERWAVPRLNGRQEFVEDSHEFSEMLKRSRDLYTKYFRD